MRGRKGTFPALRRRRRPVRADVVRCSRACLFACRAAVWPDCRTSACPAGAPGQGLCIRPERSGRVRGRGMSSVPGEGQAYRGATHEDGGTSICEKRAVKARRARPAAGRRHGSGDSAVPFIRMLQSYVARAGLSRHATHCEAATGSSCRKNMPRRCMHFRSRHQEGI